MSEGSRKPLVDERKEKTNEIKQYSEKRGKRIQVL